MTWGSGQRLWFFVGVLALVGVAIYGFMVDLPWFVLVPIVAVGVAGMAVAMFGQRILDERRQVQ